MSQATEQFNIEELFSKDHYVIPIYQRNYAWRNTEITQLIQDIVDYIKKDTNQIDDKPNYYIGTLVAYERHKRGAITYETIDGQQRLTTLTILLSLIKNEFPEIDISWYKDLKLQFDSRIVSTETLQSLFDGVSLEDKECNIAIKQGYEDAKKALNQIKKDFNLSINVFCDYLFKKVNILRVLVPHDTDLNHYFEIMNSRGEQLEKHEILKSRCLEILDEKNRYAFNLVWESCSNMEKYVQYGFTTKQRDSIFGDSQNRWNQLICYDEFYSRLTMDSQENYQLNQDEENEKFSIEELLSPDAKSYSEQEELQGDSAERFNSVINFSNFLLHILRIQTGKDIALDDKRLIELFDPYLKKDSDSNKEFVMHFGYNLLKGKFLFDKYIIKREFSEGTDQWSLKQLKWYDKNENASYVNTFEIEDNNYDENREILMLLSMFHVSNPTLVYKHWLNAALKYIFENKDISVNEYKQYLEGLAKSFLYDRFLSNNPKEYFEIIYNNDGKSLNTEINREKLNQGISVENFIFNYLDYLLWKKYKNNEEEFFTVEGRKINDNRIKNFEYTFKSSVEHYYPQHPKNKYPSIELKEEEKQKGAIDWLNSLGNLCLISSSKNSSLSNYMPQSKKEHYHQSPTLDSIKQRIMMEYKEWDTLGENNVNEIKEHGNKMIELLLNETSIKHNI